MGDNILRKIRREFIKVSTLDDDDLLNNEIIIDFINSAHKLRGETEDYIVEEFRRCFFYNEELSIRALFYIRDIKNGLGERRVFRILIKYLAKSNPNIIKNNLLYINEFGRWDDYYSLFDTPLEKDILQLFKDQIERDMISNKPSNLGKWLKSENTSSKESKYLGYRTRKGLQLSSKEYRQLLSALRKKINIIERQLSSKKYNEINIKTIPIGAAIKYRKTLFNGDNKKYLEFIEKKSLLLSRNRDLHPFNLVTKAIKKNSEFYEPIWYIQENKYKEFLEDTFIIADFNKTSSEGSNILSMFTTFLLLFNNNNRNYFKNYFMYSTSKIIFDKVRHKSFSEKILELRKIEYIRSTNIINYFDRLLFTALRKDIDEKGIPNNLLIITDIDEDGLQKYIDSITLAKETWDKSKYKFPNIKVVIHGPKESELLYKDEIMTIIKGNDEHVFTSIVEKGTSIKSSYLSNIEKINLLYKKITV